MEGGRVDARATRSTLPARRGHAAVGAGVSGLAVDRRRRRRRRRRSPAALGSRHAISRRRAGALARRLRPRPGSAIDGRRPNRRRHRRHDGGAVAAGRRRGGRRCAIGDIRARRPRRDGLDPRSASVPERDATSRPRSRQRRRSARPQPARADHHGARRRLATSRPRRHRRAPAAARRSPRHARGRAGRSSSTRCRFAIRRRVDAAPAGAAVARADGVDAVGVRARRPTRNAWRWICALRRRAAARARRVVAFRSRRGCRARCSRPALGLGGTVDADVDVDVRARARRTAARSSPRWRWRTGASGGHRDLSLDLDGDAGSRARARRAARPWAGGRGPRDASTFRASGRRAARAPRWRRPRHRRRRSGGGRPGDRRRRRGTVPARREGTGAFRSGSTAHVGRPRLQLARSGARAGRRRPDRRRPGRSTVSGEGNGSMAAQLTSDRARAHAPRRHDAAVAAIDASPSRRRRDAGAHAVRGERDAGSAAAGGAGARRGPLPDRVGGTLVGDTVESRGTAAGPEGRSPIDVAGASAGRFPATGRAHRARLRAIARATRAPASSRKAHPLLAAEARLGAPLDRAAAPRAAGGGAAAPARRVWTARRCSGSALPAASEREPPRQLKGSLHADLTVDGTVGAPRGRRSRAGQRPRLDKSLVGYARGRGALRKAAQAKVDARLTSPGRRHAARDRRDDRRPRLSRRSRAASTLQRAPLDVRLDAQRFDVEGLSGVTQELRTVAGC